MNSDMTIFSAKTVRTLERTPDSDPVSAFATIAGRIVAVGQRSDLRERFEGATVVDFGDATIVPGFNDGHAHPSMVAADMGSVDLSPEVAPSNEAIITRISEVARSSPQGRWIRARNYDHTKTRSSEQLDRDLLDKAAAAHPVIVSHVSGHWGVANSAALHAANLNDDSEPPVGGELGRDAGGRLTGLLFERAFFSFVYPSLGGSDTTIPDPDTEDWITALGVVQRRLAAAGITSVTDALVGSGELRLYQEARRRGLLLQRINMLVTWEVFEVLHDAGLKTGFGDETLRVGGIKLILDGSVSGGTCLLNEPFEHHNGTGIQDLPRDVLHEVVTSAHRSGCMLAVHANGDQAIELLLDELEEAAARWPRPGLRHRIEHCSVVTPEIIQRLKKLDVIVAPFGGYIGFHGEKLLTFYGESRLERMFAHRSFLDAGVTVAGSSDYPCGPFEPLTAMRDCVTRTMPGGQVLGATQRITAAEALGIYTVGSAEAAGEAAYKGRLTAGCVADFVVLGEDPLNVPPDHLPEIPVRSTYVGGTCVWEAGHNVSGDLLN